MTKTKIIPLVGLVATGMTTWAHAAEDCSAFSAYCTVVYKEAEDFDTRDVFDASANPLKPGWFNIPAESVPTTGINYPNNLVDPSQAGSRQPDPDPSHANEASGNAYLELLPDTFIDKDVETKVDGVNFWETPDNAPKIHYKVTFPEPGKYHVYVRANKTGSEDNGIHVGINNTWPDSGRQMQWCGGTGLWRWRGRQRNSGNFPPEGEPGHTSCGSEDTVWLDVPSAGEHTISFAGREDGFEIDRIAFVKNYQPAVRVCRPHHERVADIDCTKPWGDGVITVQSPTAAPSLQIGQTQDIVYRFTNNSENYTVSDTRLFLKLPDHLSFDGSSSGCQQNTNNTQGDEIECHVSTAISHSNHFSHRITVRATQVGTGEITSRSTRLEHDYNNLNHTPSLNVTVTPVPQEADVRAFVSSDLTSLQVGDEIKLSARVSNESPDTAASNVNISVPMLDAFEYVSADTGCTHENSAVRCTWASLATNATETREITLRAKSSGSVTFTATAGAAVDADSTNNQAQVSVTVAANPTTPTNPTNPTNPTTPTNPTNPTNPTTPTSGGGGGGGALGPWALLLGLGLLGARRRRG